MTPTNEDLTSSAPSAGDDERVVRARLAASKELLSWFRSHAGAIPLNHADWTEQRLSEILARAFLTYEATIVLSETGHWAQASMLSRSLFEDVALAHWLATHPDPATLAQAYDDHLVAVRWADLKAQEQLGLDVAFETRAWYETQPCDDAELNAIAERFRWGRQAWHRKTIQQFISGLESRRLPGRQHADERIRLLSGLHTRMLLPVNLAVHHSPVVTLQLGSRPAYLVRDVLRLSFPLFALLVRLVCETAATALLADFADVEMRLAPLFHDDPR